MTNKITKKKIIPPKKQVLIFAGAALIGTLGASLVATDKLTIWMMGISCLLFFSIMNNAMSFLAENYKQYLVHSVYGFMFLLIGIVGISTLLSGTSIFDAGHYRVITMVILAANFLFIAMIITVKGLLSLMEQKDKKL